MALEQPSLGDKIAHFDLMKKLSEDSEDSDEGDGLAEGPRGNGSSVSAPQSEIFQVRREPVRKNEGKTTTPIIPATQQAHPRTRVHELLDLTGDETVIPETKRVSKTLPRLDVTPFALPRQMDRSTMSVESPSLDVNRGKKRKRDLVKMRPENEQIFKNLQFYYIPDNDIAPARRLRINKAREYGAAWTRDPLVATHVVVDKAIAYRDVEKTMGGKMVDKVVVNEEYPMDCIRFRSVLDHGQRKYHVQGQPLVEEAKGEEVAAEVDEQPKSPNESTGSLKLKPQHRSSRKWDHVPELGTPLRSTGESSDGPAVRKDGAEYAPAVNKQSISLEIGEDISDAWVSSGKNKEGESDELSGYIAMMQEFKDLPLDNEEDDDNRSTMEQIDQSSDDEERSGSEVELEMPRGTRNKVTRFEDRFACNQAGSQNAGANNPNARTIEVLQSMANYYDRINDHWRTTGYRKAITTLKRQDVKITTEEEAYRLPHIGQRIAQKIEEIVTTNQLQRLKYAEDEPTDTALQLFLKIYGVGNKQAQRWISKGHRTLDDLREKVKLNPSQQIGIDHFEDLNTRIPRKEVEALGAFVKQTAAQVDSLVEIIIGGSYRRGSPSSNDIDFIVTKPNTNQVSQLRPFLTHLLQVLTEKGFLTARLASFHSRSDGSKFHGCCVLPLTRGVNDKSYKPIWRRIDFLLVPETEMGAALLYFTGNDIFNRSMRLLASKKGMRLNQRGLYGDGDGAGGKGRLLEGRDERRIFEILGVKWREPRERWC